MEMNDFNEVDKSCVIMAWTYAVYPWQFGKKDAAFHRHRFLQVARVLIDNLLGD